MTSEEDRELRPSWSDDGPELCIEDTDPNSSTTQLIIRPPESHEIENGTRPVHDLSSIYVNLSGEVEGTVLENHFQTLLKGYLGYECAKPTATVFQHRDKTKGYGAYVGFNDIGLAQEIIGKAHVGLLQGDKQNATGSRGTSSGVRILSIGFKKLEKHEQRRLRQRRRDPERRLNTHQCYCHQRHSQYRRPFLGAYRNARYMYE